MDCDESLSKQTVTSRENTDPNQTRAGFKQPLHYCSSHDNNNREESRYLGYKAYEMRKILKENNKNSIQIWSNAAACLPWFYFQRQIMFVRKCHWD